MAHSLHHLFGNVHLFLLSLVLCSHTIAVLSALLEKWAKLPTERYPLVTHANVRLDRALISGLVQLRGMTLEGCMPKVEQQYPRRDISPSLFPREGELKHKAAVAGLSKMLGVHIYSLHLFFCSPARGP